MALLSEKYLASDQMDYRYKKADGDIINRNTDALKGIAVAIKAAATAGKKTNLPVVGKVTSATGQVVIGALTSIGLNTCNVVKCGRFVLQANGAGAAADIGKTVIGVASAAAPGKVDAGPIATKGQIVIVGFDNDTSTDGIGHHYLCEIL